MAEQNNTGERVGFIGLGMMGHGMAKNIVEKGYPLTVMAHRNRAPVEDLVARGATEAASPKDVGAASTVVFMCVTGSTQVEALVRGQNFGDAACESLPALSWQAIAVGDPLYRPFPAAGRH